MPCHAVPQPSILAKMEPSIVATVLSIQAIWLWLFLPFLTLAYLFFFSRSNQPWPEYSPKSYPIVGCLFEYLNNTHRLLDWFATYLLNSPSSTISIRRPGSALPGLITSNPKNVERVLKTKFDNYPKGDYLGSVLFDLLGNGIFNVDHDPWKSQRKVASFEFSTRSLRDYLLDSLALETEERLLPTLDKLSQSNMQVDLQDLFLRFAFDNICKLSFGVDPGCLDPSFPKIKFAEAFDAATALSGNRFLSPHPLLWKLKRMFSIGSEGELKKAIKVVDEFASSVIKKRREELTGNEFTRENHDLLSRFMALEDTKLSSDDKFLRDIIISFVLAGRDTSSVSLAWFFWQLSLNPSVEENIYKELNEIAGHRDSKSRQSSNGKFSFEELKEMHYLHAALYESMRLYPAIPSDTKVALGDDVWEDGTVVRKGMRVTYSPYAMGRSEKIWGEDCLEFKPERWIVDGQFVPADPYKYPVFQAGPRICLGKEMATIQMKYVAAACILNYQFKVAEGLKPQYVFRVTMSIKGGLPATVHSRH